MLLGSQALTNDPYYKDVVLLLRGYDAESGQTFKDYSKYNRTVTANGNVAHSTTQKKYGNSSIYFDGFGDYLTAANSTDFGFGTGDFSIEYWIYYIGNMGTIIDFRNNESDIIPISDYIGSNGKFNLYQNAITFLTSNSIIPTNNWTHICYTKKLGTISLFINRTLDSSVVRNVNFGSSQQVLIGRNVNVSGTDYLNSYIEDVRITRRARDIVVPTQPFPNW